MKHQKYLLKASLILSFLIVAFFIKPQYVLAANSDSLTIKTIVIDPGHGGKDTGAFSQEIIEKDYVLTIAKMLQKKVISSLGIMVTLTRKGDYNIPLKERLGIANNLKADMFISLHLNAFFVPSKNGVTIYVYHKSGFPSPLFERNTKPLLWEDIQNKFIKQSIFLATCIEKEFDGKKIFNNVNPFRFVTTPILAGAAMPAILIEIGYITNPSDTLTLKTKKEEIADTIYKGILRYKNTINISTTRINTP